jgi:TRAP-type C4-dicarboxylate transport system substrate-binding protein
MKKELMIAIVFFLGSMIGVGNSAQGAPAEPIELKIMHFGSVTNVIHKDVFVPWAKILEERTGGRVKATIFPGEMLGKLKDTYDAIVAGTADIGWAFTAVTPGRFPLHEVWDLPMMFPSGRVGTLAQRELFEKEPNLRAEFREVKVLWFHVGDPMTLHTAKKPIRSLEDVKGMKIRIGGGTTPPSSTKALGAIPVFLPIPDTYPALERGTADGVITLFEAIRSFRFNEVTKYHTTVPLWGTFFYVVMNKKKFESLPPDIQKIIEDISPLGATLNLDGFEKDETNVMGELKRAGHEIITLSPEEVRRWKDKVMPIRDQWVADKETKGFPARKVYDELLRLAEKYSK